MIDPGNLILCAFKGQKVMLEIALGLDTNYTAGGTHHQNWRAGRPENPVGSASPNPTAYPGAAMRGDNGKVNLIPIRVVD